jgi:hypothetical protein
MNGHVVSAFFQAVAVAGLLDFAYNAKLMPKSYFFGIS